MVRDEGRYGLKISYKHSNIKLFIPKVNSISNEAIVTQRGEKLWN